MTRINVVAPRDLCDQHLLAEYRELPRVFGAAWHFLDSAMYRERGITTLPKHYTMGTGHVKFFYSRLGYCFLRHKSLVCEATKRGFNVTGINLDPDVLRKFPLEMRRDYAPTEEALRINRERIDERLSTMRNARWTAPAERPDCVL